MSTIVKTSKETRKEEIHEIVESIMNIAEHGLEDFYFIVWDEDNVSVCGVGDVSKAIDALLFKAAEGTV